MLPNKTLVVSTKIVLRIQQIIVDSIASRFIVLARQQNVLEFPKML